MRLILLPGFDGTGWLYGPLQNALPPEVMSVAIRYPSDHVSSANQLLEIVLSQLPKDDPYILLAESFSGPIALKASELHSRAPLALVLCASFVECPFSKFAINLASICAVPLSRTRPPHWLISRYLLCGAPQNVVSLFYRAILSVPRHVLVHRLNVLMEFDSEWTPKYLRAPLLYLQGTRDRLIKPRNARIMQNRFPAMCLQKIEAPHCVLQVQPDASARAIIQFVAAL